LNFCEENKLLEGICFLKRGQIFDCTLQTFYLGSKQHLKMEYLYRPEPVAVPVQEKNIRLYSRAASIQQQLGTPARPALTAHTPFRYTA
jgi:Tfp pilus assembly protein PilZ